MRPAALIDDVLRQSRYLHGDCFFANRQIPAHIVAGIVQALMNEQAAATRALMERWQAASEKQQTERPVRPTQNSGRKNDGTGLS